MKKKILTIGMVLALVAVLAVPMAALATNQGTQDASTSPAATILIRDVGNTADVTTITFPQGAPGAVISNPSSNIPETQILTGVDTAATPVAILTSAAAYTLWYNVTSTSTWGDAVASEKLYTIAIAGTLDLTTFGTSAYNMTTWGTDQVTTQTLAAGVNKELYLQVTLSALSGKTGTSTLTILGES